MLRLLCFGILLLPFILLIVFRLWDWATEKRDARILEKCVHIANLFHEVNQAHTMNRRLTRVYTQSSGGEPYPYDLFMVEYYGGAHLTDTIWLPVRHFLKASDDVIRTILIRELTHPGKYTVKDWQEATYQFIKREQQNPVRKQVPVWKKWTRIQGA